MVTEAELHPSSSTAEMTRENFLLYSAPWRLVLASGASGHAVGAMGCRIVYDPVPVLTLSSTILIVSDTPTP